MTTLGLVLLGCGVFFLGVGSLGVVRLPDFYTRLHASGKSDTLGCVLSMLGLAFYVGWGLDGIKLMVIAAFVFIANATATHALSRAAFRNGVEPWMRKGGEGKP